MIRNIVHIDEEKCNGCGLCAEACHEGAIEMRDGKARLIRDDYCDGLGDCLPACPAGAITIEKREAAAYDEAAVQARQAAKVTEPLACGCPGTQARRIQHEVEPVPTNTAHPVQSRLSQWPVQIRLWHRARRISPVHICWWQRTARRMLRGFMSGLSKDA